jgi:hypothetical protein
VGGLGSGRRPSWLDGSPCKQTTENYFAVDIRAVKRHGLVAQIRRRSQASPTSSGLPPASAARWAT